MVYSSTQLTKTDGDFSHNGIRLYTYRSLVDTIATMKSPGYFNLAQCVKLYDYIVLVGTDGTELVYISQMYVAPPFLTNMLVTPIATVNSHSIIAAGEHTTVGGQVTDTIPITGALETDVAMVSVNTYGATPIARLAGTAIEDGIALTFNINPTYDHVINYMLLRGN